MGAVVFLGALTASYNVVFIAVVAVWCFTAGMQSALGSKAGLVAAASAALLVISPPVAPSLTAVVLATLLTVAAGCVQAALIAVWPPQRWRVQRDALTRAYRALAADARRIAADKRGLGGQCPSDLAARSVRRQRGHPPTRWRITAATGYPSGSPRRWLPCAAATRALRSVLSPAADFLDAIANHNHTAQRDAEYALARVDVAAAAVTGPQASSAQRLSQQLHEASASRFGEFRRLDLIGSVLAAVGAMRGHLTWTSPVLRHAVRLSSATALGVAAERYGSWRTAIGSR